MFQSTAIGDGELGNDLLFFPAGFWVGSPRLYPAASLRHDRLHRGRHEATRRHARGVAQSALEESRTTTKQRWREEPLRGERREGREGTRRRGAAWREERSVGGGTSAARCWLLAVGCCCWLLAGWLLASCSRAAGRPLAASSRGLLRASKPKAAAGPRATRRKKRKITPQPYASLHPHPVQQSRSLLQ